MKNRRCFFLGTGTEPSEIVKRMNSFAEKSPDILKPILESK
ncbi:MAG: hypothetical protein U9R02_04365 [Thermodesulfobacteriota bacterium]|nr:hypothetical protein [Thermodesulfobacteriota bacterium]